MVVLSEFYGMRERKRLGEGYLVIRVEGSWIDNLVVYCVNRILSIIVINFGRWNIIVLF